jgi:RimJ/RimL family protein N-acetyltransferase
MPDLPPTLTLRDDRVLLRDWLPADWPAIEPVCGEWDVCQFSSVPWTFTQTAAEVWVATQRDRRANATALVLAITRAGDPGRRPVGTVNLFRFHEAPHNAALGYWLVPQARGEGLATAAAALLAGWGFAELGLTRIELTIRPANAASHRVAQRLGAVREGVAVHDAGGRLWEMVVYGLSPPPPGAA